MANLHDFEAKSIRGDDCRLSSFEGKVCLVVNVASACGLTPQYDGLQRLYSSITIVDSRSWHFPVTSLVRRSGTETEIATFCETNFGVQFPMFSKIDVNGDDRHPLYAWMAGRRSRSDAAGDVAWNFAKFLIGKDGNLIARFAPPMEPCAADVKTAIDEALG